MQDNFAQKQNFKIHSKLLCAKASRMRKEKMITLLLSKHSGALRGFGAFWPLKACCSTVFLNNHFFSTLKPFPIANPTNGSH